MVREGMVGTSTADGFFVLGIEQDWSSEEGTRKINKQRCLTEDEKNNREMIGFGSNSQYPNNGNEQEISIDKNFIRKEIFYEFKYFSEQILYDTLLHWRFQNRNKSYLITNAPVVKPDTVLIKPIINNSQLINHHLALHKMNDYR